MQDYIFIKLTWFLKEWKIQYQLLFWLCDINLPPAIGRKIDLPAVVLNYNRRGITSYGRAVVGASA